MRLTHLGLSESLTLSHDLLWVDEHGWVPVISNVTYSLTGALIVESGSRQGGRPITLSPPNANMAWHTRATVDTLHAWAGAPGQQFELELDDGRTFNVMFRHQEASPIDSKPVVGFPAYQAGDPWQVTLKLMEVPA